MRLRSQFTLAQEYVPVSCLPEYAVYKVIRISQGIGQFRDRKRTVLRGVDSDSLKFGRGGVRYPVGSSYHPEKHETWFLVIGTSRFPCGIGVARTDN